MTLPDSEIVYTYRRMNTSERTVAALDFAQYPSGEPLVRFNDNLLVDTILLRQKNMSAFLAMLAFVDALVERGHEVPHLIVPQFPGARQDRLNTEGDYLFTVKTFARMTNARNFPSVTVVDPHSDVTPALLDRCRVIRPTWRFSGEQYAGIVSPDAGAEKRASSWAKTNEVPLFHAWKSRDIRTGAISKFGCEPLPRDRHYLIVDDLCDGGGTFIGLEGEIKQQDCTADLYVTHGLFTKGTEPLLQRFKRVFTSDSTVGDKPGVTVIPFCSDLLTRTPK